MYEVKTSTSTCSFSHFWNEYAIIIDPRKPAYENHRGGERKFFCHSNMKDLYGLVHQYDPIIAEAAFAMPKFPIAFSMLTFNVGSKNPEYLTIHMINETEIAIRFYSKYVHDSVYKDVVTKVGEKIVSQEIVLKGECLAFFERELHKNRQNIGSKFYSYLLYLWGQWATGSEIMIIQALCDFNKGRNS